MLTPASKVYLPIAGLSLVLAFAYGISTGNRDGVLLYLALVVAATFAAMAVATARENEVAATVPADAPPPGLREVAGSPPSRGGVWPVTGALAAALLATGFVLSPVLTVAGLVMAAATVVGWMTSVSGDHTGRPPNLLPLALPTVGLFTIFSLMFFMSRVLLAVPEKASTAIALAVAVTILGAASLVTFVPSISTKTLIVILFTAGTVLLAAGLVAAAAGQRQIEKPEGVAAGAVKVVAKNLAFAEKQIELKADTPAEISFDNKDSAIPHNIAIYSDPDHTQKVFTGDIIPGPTTVDYRFKAPAAGTYYFRCDVHPNMQGKVVVAP